MIRQYKVRGKTLEVNELEGVRAVKTTLRQRGFIKLAIEKVDTNAKVLFKNLLNILPNDQLQSFSDAGWIFVKPSEDKIKKLDTRSLPEDFTFSGKVYHNESKQILVGTDRITIKLDKELSVEQSKSFFDKHNLTVIQSHKFSENAFEVQTNEDVINKVNDLSSEISVVYAEPQMIIKLDQRFIPSGPGYPKQWQHKNNGANRGVKDADMKSERAWTKTQGINTKIAIIDFGFEVTHPDLKPSTIQSGFFYTSANGTNFINSLNVIPLDDHGTFCAGLAGAQASNAGGCGVAPDAELVLIAIPTHLPQDVLARAIAYAVDPSCEVSGTLLTGVDVISCSLGPSGPDWIMESILEDALAFAVNKGRAQKGTPIFWAVSNDDCPIFGDQVSASANTISVGRSDNQDLHHNSAHGPELDFLAPGVNVYSTKLGSRYGVGVGTSYATPLAAGGAALLISISPHLSWKQVRDTMRAACDQVGQGSFPNGRNDRYGYGRINLERTLN